MTDQANSGKALAPQGCKVSDEHGITYTLFQWNLPEKDCTNDDVDFSIAYDKAKNMWQFEHILFLLGNYRKSTLSLECDVVVCDMQRANNACNQVFEACGV